MGTPVDERKHKTYAPLMEDGKVVTRQVVSIELKPLVTDIHMLVLNEGIEFDGSILYALQMYAREEEMFAGLKPSVLKPIEISIGIDGKKLRPNKIITPVGLEAETATVGLNPTSEPLSETDLAYRGDNPAIVVGVEPRPTGRTFKPSSERCPVCGGVGFDPTDPSADKCLECAGTGFVLVEVTTEPTFTIGQAIITTADIPIGESGKAPAGESGTVVEIVTSTNPNCGRIIGAWLPNWGKVSAAPTSFKVDADVEGTDSGATSEVADLRQQLSDLRSEYQNITRELVETQDKLEDALIAAKEAQEHTAPLPTSGNGYEHLTIWDTSDAKQDEMDNAGWERIHTQGMTCEGGVNRLLTVWRRVKPNGTPKPKWEDEAYVGAIEAAISRIPTPPVEASDPVAVVEVAAVMNADAEQQTVVKQDAYQQGCKWGAVDRVGNAGFRKSGVKFAGGKS